ncbi:MAG: TonB-dependent receptor [Flavobacteriaceae bacterium]|nr:TonB-dependent receptor [Flavobacteriaceae bacterium]
MLSISSLIAQEEEDLGTEVVNIVKPYTPTISDAFKIKETPTLNDSITTAKKKVQYNIFSVPVASTFTPAKGKAATVEKTEPIKLYDSYATLGFGNYTTALAELFSNFQISRTDNAGFFFRHNSSQGDIDGVILENKYYDTQLDGNYTSRQKDLSFEVTGGFEHQIFHWYGTNEFVNAFNAEEIAGIDPKQSYFSAYVGGDLAVNESIFEGIRGELRFSGDRFSSSEINFNAQPIFLFPLSDFNLKISGTLDYLNGKFDRDYLNNSEINYGYLNTEISPSLVLVNKDLTLSLGVAGVLGLDTENSSSKFYIYPRINVSYRLVDEILIAYGGADGGLRQNTYHNFRSENPFVSPTLMVIPTNEMFDVFGGIKGKLSNSLGYNLRASYKIEENKALYQINPFKGRLPNLEGYEYGNSFMVAYDDVNTLNIFGELKVEVSNTFSLGVNANLNSYSVDSAVGDAWNLPEITATVFSNFDITEKVYGGVSLFYVGERNDFFSSLQGGILIDPFEQTVTLDSYLDANVHLGYKVNERLSIFAKGSNLLGDNYQKWLNFPVQGIQGLLGATYKFDW